MDLAWDVDFFIHTKFWGKMIPELRSLVEETAMPDSSHLSVGSSVILGPELDPSVFVCSKPLAVDETNHLSVHIHNDESFSPSLQAVDFKISESLPVVQFAYVSLLLFVPLLVFQDTTGVSSLNSFNKVYPLVVEWTPDY